MYSFEQVEYFTDIALQLSGAINALFALHATVLLGALGWAISSRKDERGLGPMVCVGIAVALIAFFLVNIQSIDRLYDRANAALQIPREYWAIQPIPDGAKEIFGDFGVRGSTGGLDWRAVILAVDTAGVFVVGLLLSGLGRRRGGK